MLEDASFWALVGLIIFLGIVTYFGAPKMVAKSLDDRAVRIKRELEEARELKEEAKQQLAEYQRRRHEAEIEAREIVAAAEREAQSIAVEARAKSEDYIARRTKSAELKIAQAESDAIAEVRASAVNLAVDAAARIMAEKNIAADDAMTRRSIEEVDRRLN
jgi:F-type H+-transporting ATPase subunit b